MSQKVRMGGNDLIVDGLYVGATTVYSSGTNVTGTELGYLADVVPGTVAANTVVVASSIKAVDDLRVLVTTASSNGTAISNQGITVISTTGGSLHTLADPVAGCRKVLVSTNATTVDVTVQASTTVAINGGHNGLVFDAANELIELVGTSTTAWYIVSNPGTVGVAASS